MVDTESFPGVPVSASGTFGSLNTDGGFGGVQAGYNLQMGRWVLGVETDFQGADISDKSASTVLNFRPGLNATVTSENRVRWFTTVRPRIGFIWDRTTLLYATGGAAWGSIEHGFLFTETSASRLRIPRPQSSSAMRLAAASSISSRPT